MEKEMHDFAPFWSTFRDVKVDVSASAARLSIFQTPGT
jgi:hypothetical protein